MHAPLQVPQDKLPILVQLTTQRFINDQVCVNRLEVEFIAENRLLDRAQGYLKGMGI